MCVCNNLLNFISVVPSIFETPTVVTEPPSKQCQIILLCEFYSVFI